MARTTKDPKLSVHLSLSMKVLEKLDSNLEQLSQILISKGADPEQVRKDLSRSFFIRLLVETVANPYGFELVKNSILLAFDIDGSQTELDLK